MKHKTPFLLMLIMLLLSIASTAAKATSEDRTLIFISDLHMGPGKNSDGSWSYYEHFRAHDALATFLKTISSKGNTDLFIVGDFFELWKTTSMSCKNGNDDCYPNDCRPDNRNLGCSEEEALARVKKIHIDHKKVFDDLNSFVSEGTNTLYILPGNHDAALLFPKVSEYVVSSLSSTVAGQKRAPVFLEKGYWLSADRHILVDHGHFFDKSNAFEGWIAPGSPDPFKKDTDGTRRLQRTAGEQIVQTCVDNLEHNYPLIASFTTDDLITKQALKTACLHGKANTMSLLRLVLNNLSFKQFKDALKKNGVPVWDYDALKKPGQYKVAFMVDSLEGDEQYSKVKEVIAKDAFLDLSTMDNDSLEVLCDYKYAKIKAGNTKIAECPKKGEALGAGLDRYMSKDPNGPLKAHVTKMRDFFARSSSDTTSLSLYIYGHTHEAKITDGLPIKGNPEEVAVFNTGAFQKILTSAKWKELSGNCASEDLSRLKGLTYDNLPEAYTFVRVKPYKTGGQPSAELLLWGKTGESWNESPWKKDNVCP